MGCDKLVDSAQLDAGLTAIADTIRECPKNTGKLAFPADFVAGVTTIKNDLVGLIEGTISDVRIPEGVTKIGSYRFCECRSITSITLPSSLRTISSYAFANCTSMVLTALPSGVTSISGSAFYYCRNVAFTSLPEAVTWLPDKTFQQCTKLALTSLPPNLGQIGQYCFSGCPALAITSIPGTVTTIGNYAFQSCTGLTEITFEGTPTSIAANAFSGCTNLTTINVPWAEGEVANAPWGATNATINYTGSQMIAFTIAPPMGSENLTLTAERGMTWIDWINSEYNTMSFTFDSSTNFVKRGTYRLYNADSNALVIATSAINNNGRYKLAS